MGMALMTGATLLSYFALAGRGVVACTIAVAISLVLAAAARVVRGGLAREALPRIAIGIVFPVAVRLWSYKTVPETLYGFGLILVVTIVAGEGRS